MLVRAFNFVVTATWPTPQGPREHPTAPRLPTRVVPLTVTFRWLLVTDWDPEKARIIRRPLHPLASGM